jgi:hypothetical protein
MRMLSLCQKLFPLIFLLVGFLLSIPAEAQLSRGAAEKLFLSKCGPALPAAGNTDRLFILDADCGDAVPGVAYVDNGTVWVNLSLLGSAPAWGAITGTVSNQTDLQLALNAKVDLGGDTMSGGLSTPFLRPTVTDSQLIGESGIVWDSAYINNWKIEKLDNGFELNISAVEPTALRSILFPDADGTVALTSQLELGGPFLQIDGGTMGGNIVMNSPTAEIRGTNIKIDATTDLTLSPGANAGPTSGPRIVLGGNVGLDGFYDNFLDYTNQFQHTFTYFTYAGHYLGYPGFGPLEVGVPDWQTVPGEAAPVTDKAGDDLHIFAGDAYDQGPVGGTKTGGDVLITSGDGLGAGTAGQPGNITLQTGDNPDAGAGAGQIVIRTEPTGSGKKGRVIFETEFVQFDNPIGGLELVLIETNTSDAITLTDLDTLQFTNNVNASLGSCTMSAHGGTMQYLGNGAGSRGELYICLGSDADVYAWRLIADGGP